MPTVAGVATPSDRRQRRPHVRRVSLHGPALVVAGATLWLALATWRDGTTFHLGPAIVTAAWAVADRLQLERRLTRAEAAVRLGAGTMAALAVTVALAAMDRLDGPALVGGTATGETLLVTGATVVVTWLAVVAGRD